MRYTLRKDEIIRGKKKFKKIFSSGKKLTEKLIICFYYIEENVNELNRVQVAFAVNKKTGKAVMRNRMRRLMRESYRLNKSMILDTICKTNFKIDIVFVFGQKDSRSVNGIKFMVVENEIVQLLQKIKKIIISRINT